MEGLNLKLEQYEGPLDLLLSLIQKHKIDIFDIPIAGLTDQYLAYIAEMESYNMELSADFILMASELAFIKSKMLLPVPPEEDPRKPLVDALLEYQRAKLAAEFLGKRSEEYFDRFTKAPDETDSSYERFHPAELITEAFNNLAKRLIKTPEQKTELFERLKNQRHFSVEGKIIFVIKFLYDEKKHEFSTLFGSSKSVGELVAVFLALLQLVSGGRVNVIREDREIYLILIRNKEAAG